MDIWKDISPVVKKQIRLRIQKHSRKYTRQKQHAELLVRNPQFNAELSKYQRMRKDNDEMFGKNCQKLLGRELVNSLRKSGNEATETIEKMFCKRWRISHSWNMDLASLSKYIEIQPALIYHPKWDELPSIPFADTMILPDDLNPAYLLMQIDPWTTLEDIKAFWHHVEKRKKTIFGYSAKNKSSFGDALCWYDLHKQYGLSLLRIARLWIKYVGRHIEDEESFKITVREGIKRIDQYVKRLTLLQKLSNIPK